MLNKKIITELFFGDNKLLFEWNKIDWFSVSIVIRIVNNGIGIGFSIGFSLCFGLREDGLIESGCIILCEIGYRLMNGVRLVLGLLIRVEFIKMIKVRLTVTVLWITHIM